MVGVAAILALTLSEPEHYDAAQRAQCYLCDPIRLPDVIRNLALFVPFGAGLGLLRLRIVTTLVVALVLSAAIEALQLAIPGRESSLGDLLCNAMGAAAGAALARRHALWLRPPAGIAARMSLAAAILGAALVAGTGWLLTWSYTPTTWYAGWVPELGYLGGYRGYVVDARIGDVPLPGGGPLSDTEAVRRFLRAGAPVRVRAVAGPDPERLSPLLTIHDGEHREMLILGAEHGDFVYRQRTRGSDIGLEQPSIRIPGALAGSPPGAVLEIEVSRRDGNICVAINEVGRCGLGFSAGRAWATLFRIPDAVWLVRRSLDALWIAGIALPVALWWRPRTPAFVALALLAAVVFALPPAVGLLPPHLAERCGLTFGLALGFGMQRALREDG